MLADNYNWNVEKILSDLWYKENFSVFLYIFKFHALCWAYVGQLLCGYVSIRPATTLHQLTISKNLAKSKKFWPVVGRGSIAWCCGLLKGPTYFKSETCKILRHVWKNCRLANLSQFRCSETAVSQPMVYPGRLLAWNLAPVERQVLCVWVGHSTKRQSDQPGASFFEVLSPLADLRWMPTLMGRRQPQRGHVTQAKHKVLKGAPHYRWSLHPELSCCRHHLD